MVSYREDVSGIVKFLMLIDTSRIGSDSNIGIVAGTSVRFSIVPAEQTFLNENILRFPQRKNEAELLSVGAKEVFQRRPMRKKIWKVTNCSFKRPPQ